MGKFSTKLGKDGQYYFYLLSTNGQVILTSEGYSTKFAMQNGMGSVKINALNDKHFERGISKDGKFYFNLKAANGQVIGKSRMYASEAARNNGIESVKSNTPKARVVEDK
jgi:uncharacterized protein YegP (UPF0339 family)